MGVDPTFNLNDFNEVKILDEAETKVKNILMILFGKPNFYPSIPELGMDIRQYLYMPFDDINETSIKSKLAVQCRDFLSDIEAGSLDVYKTTHNDSNMLVFKLPIIVNKKDISVALGVTINEHGEMIYNFKAIDDTTTI